MDVYFLTQRNCIRIENGKMYAPGIGDDTANLVQLLMSVRNMLLPISWRHRWGVLFVANACEEGLGNLKGSRAVVEALTGAVSGNLSLLTAIMLCDK